MGKKYGTDDLLCGYTFLKYFLKIHNLSYKKKGNGNENNLTHQNGKINKQETHLGDKTAGTATLHTLLVRTKIGSDSRRGNSATSNRTMCVFTF